MLPSVTKLTLKGKRKKEGAGGVGVLGLYDRLLASKTLSYAIVTEPEKNEKMKKMRCEGVRSASLLLDSSGGYTVSE